jgi:hypothetical protein
MDLIQPVRHGQFIGQPAKVKHILGKRLLLIDPCPHNIPYWSTASECRAAWFSKLATPDALKALVDSDAMKIAIPNVKVSYRTFKDAFKASLQGFPLAGLERLNEDLQDA